MTSIDEYIAAQPPVAQDRLRELRAIVRTAIPDAEEVVSYGMPTYRFPGGRVYFGAARRHVAIYGFAIHAFADELRDYTTSKGTVRFPLDRPIPGDLVRAMTLATLAEKGAASS